MNLSQQKWSSSTIFVLAAVGSAAGLGNVWRFPYLAYEHGGAAFVLAYFSCLLLLGLPLLWLEIRSGQTTGMASPRSLVKLGGWQWGGTIGWWATGCAALVAVYYLAVMSWIGNYLWASPTMAWGNDPDNYFFNDVLQVSESVASWGGWSISVLIGILVTMGVVYWALCRGVKNLSHLVRWITPVPFLLVLLLAINASFLPGHGAGWSFFLSPDWSQWLNPRLWIDAASQVFFTLSLGFGVMLVYGSMLSAKVSARRTALAVVVGDTIMSLLAGLALFGVLGHMSLMTGQPLSEIATAGPGLALVVFPQALNLLPFAKEWLAFAFFLSLFALGITSLASLLKGVLTTIHDSFQWTEKKILTFLIPAVTALSVLIFARNNGIYVLDIVDHYVVNYGILLVGLSQSLILGWGISLQVWEHWWLGRFGRFLGYWFRGIVPLFLVILITHNLILDMKEPYESYPLWALAVWGILPTVLLPVIAQFANQKTQH